MATAGLRIYFGIQPDDDKLALATLSAALLWLQQIGRWHRNGLSGRVPSDVSSSTTSATCSIADLFDPARSRRHRCLEERQAGRAFVRATGVIAAASLRSANLAEQAMNGLVGMNLPC